MAATLNFVCVFLDQSSDHVSTDFGFGVNNFRQSRLWVSEIVPCLVQLKTQIQKRELYELSGLGSKLEK